MPQSLARILNHSVFSTKNREPFLQDKTFRSELHAYLGGASKTLGCAPIEIGGVSDHVHLLTTLSRTITVADFVKETKRVSTNWIKDQAGPHTQFKWQSGYECFSVSESNVDSVVQYIRDQEDHHKAISFQDEFRAFCRKHRVELDEQFVWD